MAACKEFSYIFEQGVNNSEDLMRIVEPACAMLFGWFKVIKL